YGWPMWISLVTQDEHTAEDMAYDHSGDRGEFEDEPYAEVAIEQDQGTAGDDGEQRGRGCECSEDQAVERCRAEPHSGIARTRRAGGDQCGQVEQRSAPECQAGDMRSQYPYKLGSHAC